VSYVSRTYDEIVRDMLTTLTGGTVRETLIAPSSDVPLVLGKLQQRPVRRVSHLEGTVVVGSGETARDVPYRFTAADFELISTGGDDNKDSIRFRDGGRRPKPGSTLTVNYYPVDAPPAPLTDLNVGSVIRTLVETVAREMAMAYLQLDHIYDSAFLDTAEGSSLDKVVALVGVRRLPAGFPVVQLRFSRRADAGAGSQVTIPANTAVVDASGARYLTLDALTLEPGETSREVTARGETPGVKLVEANQLTRMEVLIAGVADVTNPQPARSLSVAETDEQLRRRAAGSLHGVVRGTQDALQFSLLSIDGVKNVNIIEAPNGVAGEIRIEVAHTSTDPGIDALIDRTVREFRPAGIRVLWAKAQSQRVNVRVALTLAGSGAGVTGGVLSSLNNAVETRLRSYLSGLAPGGKARRAQMLKLVLDDERIGDAQVTLAPDGGAETDELQLPPDTTLEVVAVTFAPPAYETGESAAATVSNVSAYLPIHLAAGVTLTNASSAINTALDSYLASRGTGAPLDVDTLAAAIRDDTRFALVRNQAIVTVEGGGRFLQLTDGVGSYVLAGGERLQKGEISIEPREGAL
jgi:uncharacterized phage protein gp47/JayE